MENKEGRQGIQIEGDRNQVTQDQSIHIRVDLSGAVVEQIVVQGGMHIYLQIGQEVRA